MKYLRILVGLELNPWQWDLDFEQFVGTSRFTIIQIKLAFIVIGFSYMPPSEARVPRVDG